MRHHRIRRRPGCPPAAPSRGPASAPRPGRRAAAPGRRAEKVRCDAGAGSRPECPANNPSARARRAPARTCSWISARVAASITGLNSRSISRRSIPEQHLPFGGAIRHAELDAHEKAVELRFRQRKCADLMLRILRGHDEERRGQGVRHAIDRHVRFLHRLEQRALRLGRRAIDLIDQHHLRKQRPGVKNEALLLAVENGIADDVRRQQIAGELNAAEIQARASARGRGKASSCPRPACPR